MPAWSEAPFSWSPTVARSLGLGLPEALEPAAPPKAPACSWWWPANIVPISTTAGCSLPEPAAAFGGAADDKASGKPNAKLLATVGDQLKGASDQEGILKIAYDLEEAAAATYLFALGALKSETALQLSASILPVESQHAVVLGTALGRPASDYLPAFQTSDKAVDPAQFPVNPEPESE